MDAPDGFLYSPIAVCNKDIVFMIQDYQNPAPDSWQNFVEEIVSKLDVSPAHAQVAMVQNAKVLSG